MQQEIQDLQNRIKILEDAIFSAKGLTVNRLVVEDRIFIKKHGIKLTSDANRTGIEIRTGNGYTNATIVAEIGVVPDGSIYLSSFPLQWPLFVKYNGSWIQVTLP